MKLNYDNIPQSTPVKQLQQKAFENLQRAITYRMVESKEKSFYDFQLEYILL